MTSTTKKMKIPSLPSFKKKKKHQQNEGEEVERAEETETVPMAVIKASSSDGSLLMDLSDDLLLNILTFLADVPFEGADMDRKSTLTHTLPYINHRIHEMCQQDFLWRMALLRLLKQEPYLWEEGINRVFKKCRTRSRCMNADSSSSSSKKKQKMTAQSKEEEKEETKVNNSSREEKLIDDTIQQMLHLSQQQQQSQQQHCSTAPKNNRFHPSLSSSRTSPSSQPILASKQHPHLSLFKQTVSTHIKQTHPIFYMPGTVQLGRVFGLHFFEPRYRLLISEVMSTYPVGFRRGETITSSSDENDDNDGRFPEFIYGHVAPLAPTSPACIVQVRQCHIYPDGTADVLLMPAAYVWMERVWERPNSGGLAYGRVIRMGADASRALERSIWAGIGSRFSPGGGTWGEVHDVEEEDDGEGEVVIGDEGGDGVRGSIHAILAYLAAREQGMQEFQNAEDENEE